MTQFIESIFKLLNIVAQDLNRSEALLRSAMGVIGYISNGSRLRKWPTDIGARDLADTFPRGEYANYYRAEWVTQLIKETRSNRDFQGRTIDTARWAREQVKRQIASVQGAQMSQG